MYFRDTGGFTRRLLSESTSLWEMGSAWVLRRQRVRLVPEGDGHPIMLIPGFTATDGSTAYLRRFLKEWGYEAKGWRQGRNLGVSAEGLRGVEARVDELVDRSGEKLSLIGWSGGGMDARALANRLADRIRQVITMGSPFKLTEDTLDHLPEGITRLHERLSPRRGHGDEGEEVDAADWHHSPPVPSSSLFSQRDGLAPWPFCLDRRDEYSENVHVPGSHAGMTFTPFVYCVLVDRLAQPEGDWRPFDIGRLRRVAFRHACASQLEQ